MDGRGGRFAYVVGPGGASAWLRSAWLHAMDAIQLVREDMNRLRGRLFELVEAVGLPIRQEEAFKKVIRRMTYDSQAQLEDTLRGGT